MTWIKATSLVELREKPVVLNHPPLQIALFLANGRVYAVDNRCPHEGYPLVEGIVNSDCVLTCNWHNWKFRLEDGQCVLGGDNVRTYPTRLEGNQVWIDVSPPSLQETRQIIVGGLRKAFLNRDFGRICREIARLHFNGMDPKDAVREAIAWSYDRQEPGLADGHGYAGAADWLTLAKTFDDDFERELICFAEPVDHMAFDSLRQPQFPYAKPGEPFERDAFLAAVENEDRIRVEGMVARALSDGLHWQDLEESFVAAAMAHYSDFGHSVIYISKISELIQHLGAAVEPYLLLFHSRQLCYPIREDLIPEFRGYGGLLQTLPEPLFGPGGDVDLDLPFPCTVKEAFQWLFTHVGAYPVSTIYNAMVAALARNLLHYDTRYGTSFDRPVSLNASWLALTHGVTFSSAARTLCEKYPQYWRPALLQMACFVGRNSRYLDRQLDTARWSVTDATSFIGDVHEKLLDHGISEPIIAVHLLKTTIAVERELPLAKPRSEDVLLASLNRFLNSPFKMKHARRLARQAVTLVARDFQKPPSE
jgi:nitrite reductase/ring-hydroxylating ferredoxin subunit